MKFLIPIFFLLFVFSAAFSPGQDRITVSGPPGAKAGQGTPLVVEGTILDYSPREGLVFQKKNAGKEFYRYEQLIRIDPDRSETAVAADEQFASGEFAKALEHYGKARDEETRHWAKFYWTAKKVRCFTALDRNEEAYNEFFVLCQNEPFSPFFDAIPLVWASRLSRDAAAAARIERAALPWLDPLKNPSGKYNPAASLLAASILWNNRDPATRKKAIERMEWLTLANRGVIPGLAPLSPDMRTVSLAVAQSANAQMWRGKIAQNLNEKEIALWENTCERMPESIRCGPLCLIGDAYAKLGRQEKAIAFWMYAPVVYPEQRFLAARSLWLSGQELSKLSRREQALGLYVELIEKYPDMAEFADQARKLPLE